MLRDNLDSDELVNEIRELEHAQHQQSEQFNTEAFVENLAKLKAKKTSKENDKKPKKCFCFVFPSQQLEK